MEPPEFLRLAERIFREGDMELAESIFKKHVKGDVPLKTLKLILEGIRRHPDLVERKMGEMKYFTCWDTKCQEIALIASIASVLGDQTIPDTIKKEIATMIQEEIHGMKKTKALKEIWSTSRSFSKIVKKYNKCRKKNPDCIE